MAGELEICVQELNSGKETYMMLPWSMGEIYDDLDRCKIFDEYLPPFLMTLVDRAIRVSVGLKSEYN